MFPSFSLPPALRYRDFRLLWFGLLISFSGSMMQNAAILWHVSLLVSEEQKGLALGLVGLARIAPLAAFSLLSGVIADALDRRRLMLATNISLMVIAAMLALITFSGLTVVWPIYLLTACSAAIGSFDNPARQSLIPNLVSREHLPNALSLNSIMFQTASVIGPALAGLVIAGFGVGWAYVVNAISFLAVVAAILLMRGQYSRAGSERSSISVQSAFEGLRFVFNTPLIAASMLLDFFATFFATANALLPIFAQDILRVGASGYGWLAAAPSVGAMITGLIMVKLVDRIQRRGQALFGAVFVFGLATVAFGFSQNFWLSFFCLFLTGAADMISTVLRNILRQLHTPDSMRGRMTSVGMLFFVGGPQLGELEAGLVAGWLGAPFSVISGGIGCLIATLWVARKWPVLWRYHQQTLEPSPVPKPSPAD